MKSFRHMRTPERADTPTGITQDSGTRRTMLRSLVASLAAYATSFFVSEPAHAFCPSQCNQGCPTIIPSNACIAFFGQKCTVHPSGEELWQAWLYQGERDENGCCTGGWYGVEICHICSEEPPPCFG